MPRTSRNPLASPENIHMKPHTVSLIGPSHQRTDTIGKVKAQTCDYNVVTSARPSVKMIYATLKNYKYGWPTLRDDGMHQHLGKSTNERYLDLWQTKPLQESLPEELG